MMVPEEPPRALPRRHGPDSRQAYPGHQGYASFLENVVIPNAAVFSYLVVFGEILLGLTAPFIVIDPQDGNRRARRILGGGYMRMVGHLFSND